MDQAKLLEFVDKIFAEYDINNTGSIPQSKVLDIFQSTLKAAGSDKVLTQAEIDEALAKVTFSNPTTITKAEFLDAMVKSASPKA